jgi:hypothetical protein
VHGWGQPLVLAAMAGGVILLGTFAGWEYRAPAPMLPLDLFASAQFTAANIVTFIVQIRPIWVRRPAPACLFPDG